MSGFLNAGITNDDKTKSATADEIVDYVGGEVSSLPLSGGTMTGQAVGITPVAAGDMTRKDYVDLKKANTDFLRTGDRLDITNVPVA
jgi:hypothetical protein